MPPRETILIVEDDPSVMRLVVAILDADYELLCAESGEEALRIGNDWPAPIHLLLADVVLPRGFLGNMVAEHLKCARPDICVVLMSGSGSGVEEIALLHKGWRALRKPFVRRQLLGIVAAALMGTCRAAGVKLV